MPQIADGDPRQIGCAYEYTAFVTARDLVNRVGLLPWSSLTWSRVLDDVSEATVRVPDALGGLRCNVAFSSLQPWRYGLLIERNGVEVWRGPIVSIQRPPRADGMGGDDYVDITAVDKMGWLRKRTASQDLSYGTPTAGVDAGVVFSGVIDDAVSVDNVFDIRTPNFTTGFTMAREVLALDFETTADIVDDLARSAVDWFIYDSDLVVRDQGTSSWVYEDSAGVKRVFRNGDAYGGWIFGTFTDEAWVARPGYSLDGWAQANTVYVPGADSGEAGARRYWWASDVDPLDGVLVRVDTNALYRPQSGTPITADAVFQERADSLLAASRITPVIISAGPLSSRAPVSIPDLLPGSLWVLDLAEEGIAALVTLQRLKRVDITVSKESDGSYSETVVPVLIQLGSDESQGVYILGPEAVTPEPTVPESQGYYGDMGDLEGGYSSDAENAWRNNQGG